MKDEFKLFGGFALRRTGRPTYERTFVIGELLSRLKMLNSRCYAWTFEKPYDILGWQTNWSSLVSLSFMVFNVFLTD